MITNLFSTSELIFYNRHPVFSVIFSFAPNSKHQRNVRTVKTCGLKFKRPKKLIPTHKQWVQPAEDPFTTEGPLFYYQISILLARFGVCGFGAKTGKHLVRGQLKEKRSIFFPFFFSRLDFLHLFLILLQRFSHFQLLTKEDEKLFY